jgi:hypothetical protein
MTILNEINRLIILSEEEYYGGGPSDFIDRHKGKLLAAGALGLAHSGYLGPGAQDLANTGLRAVGQIGQKALNLGQKGVNWVSKTGTIYPIPGHKTPWIGTTS